MPQATPNPYLRTQLMTAGPMQLRLLLYDGALKYARHGRQALENQNYAQSYDNIAKARNIVLELANSLNHEQAPELCDNLAALYNYIYRRLVEANLNRDAAVLDEVIELLEYERETWRQLMDQVDDQHQPENAGSPHPSSPGAPGAPAPGPYVGPIAPAAAPNGAGQSTLSKSA